MNEMQQRRLRYRLRRGLLEMDLLLNRFAEHHLAGLTIAELAALDRLLDLPDTELLRLVLGQGADAARMNAVGGAGADLATDISGVAGISGMAGVDVSGVVAKIRGHSVAAGMFPFCKEGVAGVA